jgi:putative transposase
MDLSSMTVLSQWPHAPAHWTFDAGIYMVTAGLYKKQALLNTPERRDAVLSELFACAREFEWHLQAWAVMSNHYHFVARTERPETLRRLTAKVHGNTTRLLNRADQAVGRRVWFEYWDTHISYEKSWLARLKYVHNNPVHHGVTHQAQEYRWCSAGWFDRSASPAFVASLERFKIDKVAVPDDF